MFRRVIGFKENPYHPMVWINGNPFIGEGTYIGGFSNINANKTHVNIGRDCDISSFVAINAADSHKKGLGILKDIVRKPITLCDNVFVGSHVVIKGGAYIGHHSVVASGTIVGECNVPPYSLVIGNPMVVKAGYYKDKIKQVVYK